MGQPNWQKPGQRLLARFDDYETASGHIRNDPGTNPGAEELIEIDDCDLQAEEYFRNNMTALADSLSESSPQPFEFTEEEETWLFTDGATQGQFELHLIDNKSDGWFFFITECSGFWVLRGNVECVIINGTQITLELVSWGMRG